MHELTITSKGQVTLKKGVLAHLGVEPGQSVEVTLESGGRASIRAARGIKDWSSLRGRLKGAGGGLQLSIEEMNAAIAESGAAAGMDIER